MRVAVFTPYLPHPPDTGGKIRSHHLLRALAARFDVDLVTVHHGEPPAPEDVQALEGLCRSVTALHVDLSWGIVDRWRRTVSPLPRAVDYFHTRGTLAAARRHLEAAAPDVVVADEICMTPYAELLDNRPRVVIRHKIDHRHAREVAAARPFGLTTLLERLEATKLRRYERAKMPLYAACLTCSEDDLAAIAGRPPQAATMVIPNGVDLASFTPRAHAAAPEPPVLLYVGSMDYYPNIDAMRFFFGEMFERVRREVPGVRVRIVGHAPPPEIAALAERPGVEVTGSVPDVRPHYADATVFMVPLRLGGGTRLKIVEAMAMGAPVVSTAVGAEGLDIHPGDDILVADDAAAFADAVVRLLRDPELRRRIADGGARLARRYDWTVLCRPFADLVEQAAR